MLKLSACASTTACTAGFTATPPLLPLRARHAPRSATVALLAAAALLSPVIPAHAQQGGWSIATRPLVSIGSGASAREELFEAGPALRLRDGTIVVPNGGTREIRFFNPSGVHLRTAGRSGAGPGEFQALSSVWRTQSDTIVVWDGRNRRLTFIDGTGRIAGALPFAATGTGVPVALMDGGRILVARHTGADAYPFAGREGETQARMMTFAAVSRDGNAVWSTEPLVRNEMFGLPFQVGGSRILAPMDLPFGRRTHWTVYRDTLFYGTGDAFRIAVVAPDGRVVRHIGSDSRRPVLSSAMKDQFRRNIVAVSRSSGDNDVAAAFIAALDRGRVPFPAHAPAHGRILVDRLGFLWVQDPDTGGTSYTHFIAGGGERPGSRTWTVMRRDGHVLQRLEMPSGLRVDDIGADYVVGVVRDAFDVEHVRMYALRRG